MHINNDGITDINSLISAIDFAYNRFGGQVWWRGQRDYDWPLRPSVFRGSKGYSERSGMLRFQQRAYSRHKEVPPISDNPGWLFLGQHYRLPTRLLDWTESPLVASYFASDINESHLSYPEAVTDNDGALFALSPYILNEYQIGKKGLLMPESVEASSCISPAFTAESIESNKVIAIRPSEVDIRLMMQLSVFTLSGYNISLDSLPSSEDFLVKFRIPKEAKVKLRTGIKHMGIRLSTLFPDLEHLAQEIRELEFEPSDDRDERIGPPRSNPPNSSPTTSGIYLRSIESST